MGNTTIYVTQLTNVSTFPPGLHGVFQATGGRHNGQRSQAHSLHLDQAARLPPCQLLNRRNSEKTLSNTIRIWWTPRPAGIGKKHIIYTYVTYVSIYIYNIYICVCVVVFVHIIYQISTSLFDGLTIFWWIWVLQFQPAMEKTMG